MAQNKTQYNIRTLDIDKKIVKSIDNGILVLNEDLVIFRYNKWLELHTGLKEASVLEQTIDSIFSNINTKTLKRKIKTALRIQTPTFYTASTSKYLIPIKINQLKNSTFEYMQQDVSIIPFDEEKGLVALVITDQTIMANTNTQLHNNIQTIKELNSELIKERDTIDKKVLFIKLNTQNVIIDVSQALLELLKYDKDELTGLDFLSREKYTLSSKNKEAIEQHTKILQVLEFEESTLSSHGDKICFKSSLVPEYNAIGKHIGFILFRENITDAKHLAQSQEKMLTSSRSAAMGEMISMIAHQWRQPLSLINTIMATIKIKRELRLLDDAMIVTAFEKIELTTQNLSETIDDFRDYFKPGKISSTLNILELFEKSIFFLKEEMYQHSINYTITIEEPIEIVTYKNEFLQTIINIIKNSIDAFNDKKDMQDKNINVTIKKYESHISISIEDNAGGIEADVLKKVFEPYFSTKSKNGTGLGLYMCHRIVTEHLRGRITMSSKENQTTTLIELPYKII